VQVEQTKYTINGNYGYVITVGGEETEHGVFDSRQEAEDHIEIVEAELVDLFDRLNRVSILID
jgi:hypothetical protein